MKTENIFYQLQYRNTTNDTVWRNCIYWDDSSYQDMTADTIENLLIYAEEEYGPKEYLKEQLKEGHYRIIKVKEIVDRNEEVVTFE
jgi:hypothetical protein